MFHLKRLILKGFRSVRELDLELAPINIFIGANGAGKSNLISFFTMLNQVLAGALQEYIATTGGARSLLHFGPKVTRDLECRLEFVDTEGEDEFYAMRLSFTADDSLAFTSEELGGRPYSRDGERQNLSFGAGHRESKLQTPDQSDNQVVKKVRQYLLNRCLVYHFHDTSDSADMRLSGWIGNNLRLESRAGNLAAMLYAYQQSNGLVYSRIVNTVRRVLPEFQEFVLEPDRIQPLQIYLKWKQAGSDYVFGPHQMSDGSLRAIALITLLLQPQDDLPLVIVLDEPELGLHPAGLNILTGLLQSVSHHCQIIVATQSVALVDGFESHDIVVVDRVSGASQFQRLNEATLHEWLQDYTLGQLWEKNVIGGGPF